MSKTYFADYSDSETLTEDNPARPGRPVYVYENTTEETIRAWAATDTHSIYFEVSQADAEEAGLL